MNSKQLMEELDRIEDKSKKVLLLNGSVASVTGIKEDEFLEGVEWKVLQTANESYEEEADKIIISDDCLTVNQLIDLLAELGEDDFISAEHSSLNHVCNGIVDIYGNEIPGVMGIVSILHCL